MRAKLLFAMCLASMPMCMVGCDSSTENQVGTGAGVMPADVKERLEKQNKAYEEAMKKPIDTQGRSAPPGN
ncbi:MAG: hypothetical protein ACK5GJ_16285 [Planctomycetota bacterium]|jgi:hypothetical protein